VYDKKAKPFVETPGRIVLCFVFHKIQSWEWRNMNRHLPQIKHEGIQINLMNITTSFLPVNELLLCQRQSKG
jgi:hypothetical protein